MIPGFPLVVRSIRPILLLTLLVLFTYWIFIDTYRLNAFNIVPHDDYAPYLLYFLNEEGGRVLNAPFAYRALSVIVAVPFYYVLPFFQFSRLEDVNETYLRAIEALAMVSYLSMLASSILIYLITRNRFGSSGPTAVIASLVAILLFQFSGYKGIDPIGILVVCLLVYYSANFLLFGALILLSIGFNEKISLIFSMLMISRLLFERDARFVRPAIMSVLAFAAYLIMRMVLGISGNEGQLQVSSFLSGAVSNVLQLASLKNIVLIVVPMITLTILYGLAAIQWKFQKGGGKDYFSVSDISALIGLFVISMAVGVQSFSRMGMFCFPLYLPLAVIYVSRIVSSLDSDAGTQET